MTTSYRKDVAGWSNRGFSASSDEQPIKTRTILTNPMWDTTYRKDYCPREGLTQFQTSFRGSELANRLTTRSIDMPTTNIKVWQTTYQKDFCERFDEK